MDGTTSSSGKAEPPKTNASNVDKTKTEVALAVPEKTSNVDSATNQLGKTEGVSSENNVKSTSSNSLETGKRSHRPPPTFDAATELRVRDLMMQARKVANSGDNSFKSEEDIYDLALLANNLVQLLNAAYIATDTIVRGVSYMQGGSQPHPKTAMSFARRDRRTQLAQRDAGDQALDNATNVAPAVVDTKNITEEAKPTTTTEANTVSNKENVASAADNQQQGPETAQTKPKKKKGFWQNRRSKRKDSAGAKQGEGNGAGETADAFGSKDTAKEAIEIKKHQNESSSSDTAVDGHGEGEGVPVAVKA